MARDAVSWLASSVRILLRRVEHLEAKIAAAEVKPVTLRLADWHGDVSKIDEDVEEKFDKVGNDGDMPKIDEVVEEEIDNVCNDGDGPKIDVVVEEKFDNVGFAAEVTLEEESVEASNKAEAALRKLEAERAELLKEWTAASVLVDTFEAERDELGGQFEELADTSTECFCDGDAAYASHSDVVDFVSGVNFIRGEVLTASARTATPMSSLEAQVVEAHVRNASICTKAHATDSLPTFQDLAPVVSCFHDPSTRSALKKAIRSILRRGADADAGWIEDQVFYELQDICLLSDAAEEVLAQKWKALAEPPG